MDIIWSPINRNEFILYGNNILLYRISSLDNTINRNRIDNNLFLNDYSYAKLIGSINNYQSPKIVSWYPGLELSGMHHCTLAMHEQNQSQLKLLGIPIANLDQSNQPNNELAFLDMEHPIKINQLKWNQKKTNYLGIGCDKSNDKSTIMIWDPFVLSTKASYELNEYNSCESFCWNPETPELLYATTSNNCLSLYDLRVGVNPIEAFSTRYIKGFEIDFENSYRAISFDQNKLAVWDLRKFSDEKCLIAEIEDSKQIKKVNFCPAKSDRYAVLNENSTQVNIYRFEESNRNLNRETINYLKYHKNTSIINTFCWHLKDYNRLLVSLAPYNNLMDLVVSDYCPIDFSINENLNVGINDKVLLYNSSGIDDKDIGEKMKIRALKSYGVNESFLSNLDLISNADYESDLRYLWQWFDLSNKVYDKSGPEKYIGIKTIVSTINHNSSDPNLNVQNLNEIYKNYILKMCGWNNLKELISQLEEKKEYERAACICVFNKNLEKAIELLTTASRTSNLNEYLGLSLALNFILNNPNDYKDSSRILNKLTNPYLKALFSYQIDPETFDSQIYCDQNILIPDRIGMALNIFKIEQLTSFINKLANDCIKQGNLYGILLTGLNSDSIELFQTYINITSDVQTAAVAIIHSNCSKTIANKYVNAWIESYRELLDKWMLWEQRAKYDICRQEFFKRIEKERLYEKSSNESKIHIRCGYCAENISTKRKLRNVHETAAGANIGMTCQSCQKPSLRCSVCNLYMTVDPPKSAISGEKDKMAYWFVFCQKCTHGGHLEHLVGWFKTNPECPVMNCSCLCYIPEGILDE